MIAGQNVPRGTFLVDCEISERKLLALDVICGAANHNSCGREDISRYTLGRPLHLRICLPKIWSRDTPRASLIAGLLALLLALGVLVNYFDRVNLSVSHDALVKTFNITPDVFGQLSAAYSWTYAACQLPTGMLLDNFGVRKVSLISIFVWGMASIAAAFAPSVLLFFAARLLLGIGEAPTFPASAKAVGVWFPAHERSFATAMFDSTAKLANAIGVPMLGLLILQIGWRRSFGFTALLSFGYLAVFALLYREPQRFSIRNFVRRDSGAGDFELMLAPPIPLSRLLRERKVLGAAIGSGAYNYVFYLLLTWLPTYLAQTQHITLRQSFLFTGAPWLIAACCGLLIGGVLVDLLIKRGFDASAVRRTVLIAGTCCGLGIAGAAFAHSIDFGADLDHDCHRRPFRRFARAVEPADTAGAELKRREGRRHHELLQPDLGDRRTHPDRMDGGTDEQLYVGLRDSDRVHHGGYRGVCDDAWTH